VWCWLRLLFPGSLTVLWTTRTCRLVRLSHDTWGCLHHDNDSHQRNLNSSSFSSDQTSLPSPQDFVYPPAAAAPASAKYFSRSSYFPFLFFLFFSSPPPPPSITFFQSHLDLQQHHPNPHHNHNLYAAHFIWLDNFLSSRYPPHSLLRSLPLCSVSSPCKTVRQDSLTSIGPEAPRCNYTRQDTPSKGL
jgi:hypothetical protein